MITNSGIKGCCGGPPSTNKARVEIGQANQMSFLIRDLKFKCRHGGSGS